MIKQKEETKKLCDYCIKEGENLCKIYNDVIDIEKFTEWYYNCKLLISRLSANNDWQNLCENKENTLSNAQSMLGGLRSIKIAIENDCITYNN